MALILSDRVIEHRVLHKEVEIKTWANWDVRTYLNKVYHNRFSESDRAYIVETNIETKKNPWYGTGGANTTDKIFLLSLEEVVTYFGDSGQLKKRPNDNARWIDDEFNSARIAKGDSNSNSSWGLRSYGYSDSHSKSGYAAYVYNDGIINVGGDYTYTPFGIRPAMWINLS
jgi:hypothetical protein